MRACVRVCVCVCVRERESWGRGWGLGGMELRVGSNIMIHCLYILLILIWHMYFLCVYYALLVVYNYMYYVCETQKMLENVVKRSEFGYTRE